MEQFLALERELLHTVGIIPQLERYARFYLVWSDLFNVLDDFKTQAMPFLIWLTQVNFWNIF